MLASHLLGPPAQDDDVDEVRRHDLCQVVVVAVVVVVVTKSRFHTRHIWFIVIPRRLPLTRTRAVVLVRHRGWFTVAVRGGVALQRCRTIRTYSVAGGGGGGWLQMPHVTSSLEAKPAGAVQFC